MRNHLLLLVSFFVMQAVIYSQSCLPEGIVLSTQAQIDSFQADYPGCSTIQGDVHILGADISDLSALIVVDSIFGDLVIGTDWPKGNNNLVDLEGLENIKFIGGDLLLHYNASLVSIMGLSGLTKILGDFRIIDNISLTSLNGLENLDSLFGDLGISNNDLLSDLTGFNGLEYIDHFYCHDNNGLMSLQGLNNVKRINKGFILSDNEVMTCITGLDSLSFIGYIYLENTSLNSFAGLEHLDTVGAGNLQLIDNIDLTDLDGLANLKFISGTLEIDNNDNLSSLEGLIGLTSAGYLFINGNSSLTNLAGLENINSSSLSGIWIANNPNLSDCNIQTLCDYLATPTGFVSIVNNAIGCGNPPEIAEYCDLQLNCLPYGNYYFINQQDIDNFPSDYSDCSKLSGYIGINGSGIINIDSLSGIDTINGTLRICGTSDLTSLNGLHNVRTILGDLYIGYYVCGGNAGLTDLTGLNTLTSVGGDMLILYNEGLISLSGLDSLNHVGQEIGIHYNGLLTECNISSICDLIYQPGINISFGPNAPGCNNQEEVEAACGVGLNESSVVGRQSSVSIYPNPATDLIFIEIHENGSRFQSSRVPGSQFQISIFDLSGQEVIARQASGTTTDLDISELPGGVYFVSVVDVKGVLVGKFVKIDK